MFARACWLLSLSVASAQGYQGAKYVDEIGHLGTEFDPRKSADLGVARAFPTSSGEIRFEGRDDHGRPWRALIPVAGGIAGTEVWRGDFDLNSRPDLMIAARWSTNGRCVDRVTLTFLMFDLQGRPVPWTAETQLPLHSKWGKLPALLRRGQRDAPVELVVSGCEYAPPERFGEDRHVTGVYEPQDAHWRLVRPVDVRRYNELLRANYAHRAVNLQPTEPAAWMDLGNAEVKLASRRIEAVTSHSPRCVGVQLDVVDGRVVAPKNDWCDAIGKYDRFTLSSGETCFAWPTIVVDDADSLEIIDSKSSLLETKLRELASRKLLVTAIGQTDSTRCSPTMLIFADGQR